MAWDFSTEPEFQEKLDWVDDFCKEKVEPLDYIFPYAVRSPDPVVKAYVRELQHEVEDQGLWAIFLDRELGGPGFGQLKLALLNEILGRYASVPRRRTPETWRCSPRTERMSRRSAGSSRSSTRTCSPLTR
jgi:alkylation response protein AidB-like acyl-CoA dehydrogenase